MKTDRRLSATALAFPFFFQTAYSDGSSVAVEVYFLKNGGERKELQAEVVQMQSLMPHYTEKHRKWCCFICGHGTAMFGGKKNIWSEFIGKELFLNSKNDEIFSVNITYMGRWHLKPHQTFTWMCHFNPVKSAWTSTDRWPVEITEVAENAATHSNRPIIEQGSV